MLRTNPLVYGFRFENAPLYFVTDHDLLLGRRPSEVVYSALQGGVSLVQFRDKKLQDEDFIKEGRKVLALCRNKRVPMLVNDRVEAAALMGADGVHLGQDDMSPTDAREILGEDAIIGLSTHTLEEAQDALEQPVDYINIGPMFPTETKKSNVYQPLGLEKVLEIAAEVKLPFTTMGGIKKHHLRELFSRGIRTVAMVSEISMAEDVTAKVRELLAEIRPT